MIVIPFFKDATLLPPLRHLSVNYRTPKCPLRVPASGTITKSVVELTKIGRWRKSTNGRPNMDYKRSRDVQYFLTT